MKKQINEMQAIVNFAIILNIINLTVILLNIFIFNNECIRMITYGCTITLLLFGIFMLIISDINFKRSEKELEYMMQLLIKEADENFKKMEEYEIKIKKASKKKVTKDE